MVIENIMYFALGLLVAGLVALVILPAVWKRAVRLTKRRIEAATPITMAEFRADKDQLRAEFALSTRRLEMNVETLRARLAEQLGDANQKRSDLGMLQAERTQHLALVSELEAREAELRARTTELERETTDLSQRLRMRDRELDTRNEELGKLRDALAGTEDEKPSDKDSLVAAEARIASAESRLNALLAETTQTVEMASDSSASQLADRLNLEADVEQLRRKVSGVESAILKDWDTDKRDEARLRERLNDIAASVSRLVYAVDTETPAPPPQEESLFDRVQRFADDGVSSVRLGLGPHGSAEGNPGAVGVRPYSPITTSRVISPVDWSNRANVVTPSIV
jgi:hypothetical protein